MKYKPKTDASDVYIGAPTHCANCGVEIKTEFFDAAIGGKRPWGNFCRNCFSELGCQLGTGRGQHYIKVGDEFQRALSDLEENIYYDDLQRPYDERLELFQESIEEYAYESGVRNRSVLIAQALQDARDLAIDRQIAVKFIDAEFFNPTN